MAFSYSEKLSKVFNQLSEQGLAKQTRGGMWYETHGVAVHYDRSSKEERYIVRSEHPVEAERERMTAQLQTIFSGSDYVTVAQGKKPQTIGPRS